MRLKPGGFTIVELLIVIVVIAILAAVSIVAYNGVQNRAYETSVANDFRNFDTKAELYKIDQGRFPLGGSSTDLPNIQTSFTFSAYVTGKGYNNILYCAAGSGTNYALVAEVKSGKVLYMKSTDKAIREYTGTWPPVDPTGQHSTCVDLGIAGGGWRYKLLNNGTSNW